MKKVSHLLTGILAVLLLQGQRSNGLSIRNIPFSTSRNILETATRVILRQKGIIPTAKALISAPDAINYKTRTFGFTQQENMKLKKIVRYIAAILRDSRCLSEI
jgi:hypothetical protein